MTEEQKNIFHPLLDLLDGLWRRADRDFPSRKSRDAFRETCFAVLRGKSIMGIEPDENTPRDSEEWAKFVAACDCKGFGSILASMSDLVIEKAKAEAMCIDDSDSSTLGSISEDIRLSDIQRATKRINQQTDRRFKANQTAEQRAQQRKNLEYARAKAEEVRMAAREYAEDVSSSESSDVEYTEKRKKNSRPNKVPLPDLPVDYKKENEWVRKNIKSPDMLYSYVRAKAGDGIRWSSGMRKYFDNNDFWEFAFDTLSSGGWCDSEFNRPICNVSKYITKVIIDEFSRHEASKHSRFEGKFKNGAELLEYIKVHCSGIRPELQTEAYCSWFLQRMNDIGWRWNNGSTINNIPGQMAKLFDEFKQWCATNKSSLVGLNDNQYGETLRIQSAIASGEWKPRANGKFSALDLKKYL